jgi:hypothetical protein
MTTSSSTMKKLLKFARSVVNSVSNQVNNQYKIIQEQVAQRIQQMVQSVTNGIWIGNGANEFVREMTQIVLPQFGVFMTVVQTTNTHLTHAVELIDAADKNSLAKVNDLVEKFRAIY